jgi:hypothetical protein
MRWDGARDHGLRRAAALPGGKADLTPRQGSWPASKVALTGGVHDGVPTPLERGPRIVEDRRP